MKLTFTDLEDVDYLYARSLLNLKDIDVNGIVTEAQFKELIPSETFMGTSFSGKRVALFPNSQSTFLSLENRNRFVDLAVKQRLEEMVPAANLIREGICEIVPVPILDLMPIDHLEKLVAGLPKISVEALKALAKYRSANLNSPEMKCSTTFWG